MENIHEHNPYRYYHENVLTSTQIRKAIELQKSRIYICLLSGTDAVVGAVYCIVGYYQLIFSVIFSVLGYIGAISYNRTMMIAYIFNVSLLVLGRVFLLCISFQRASSDEGIDYVNGNVTYTIDPIGVSSICLLSLITELCIFYYAITFYLKIYNSRLVR